jgi:hypothetical protein
MAEIVYKSLSALTPVELKYQYYKEEELQNTLKTYNNGISFYETDSFKNYRDIAINKDSCFVLTSSVNLNSVFAEQKSLTIGTTPVSIKIGQRLTTGINPIYYAKYNELQDTFRLTLTAGSTFYLQPVEGVRNTVEMFVEGNYVQVDELYPYVVRLSDRTISDPDNINRQRFEVVYNQTNNSITFKTLTNSGYRFLAFNGDNILRATGLVFNENEVNDYIFEFTPVTNNTINYDFNPTNNWVTYFFDVESRQNNKNLTINKDFYPVPTNLLVDFPIEKAAETGAVVINIANLKTGITPAGGPAPVVNDYIKEVITTN